MAISKEVQKRKFKFNTRGKLKKEEILEIKRTHKRNIFSWLDKEKAKGEEMDKFEEKESTVDMVVQAEAMERDLDKESRFCKIKKKQKEFLARRLVQEVIGDVLMDVAKYRPGKVAKEMLEEVLIDVIEQALVNKMYQEVVEIGPSALSRVGG